MLAKRRERTGADRLDTGTGLGLAIAHACATRHGGTVEVDDSPLGGASFIVRLPASSTTGSGRQRHT